MNLRRYLLIAVVMVALIAAAIGAWFWYHGGGEDESSNRLRLYGNIEIREVALAFEIQGRLESMEVEEGDTVEARDLLATVEATQYRHQLDQARARVETQTERLAELEAGTRPQNIRKAEAEVEAAEARLVEAKRNYERIASLVPSEAATPQELDDARAARDTAEAEVRLAQAALDLAEAGPRKQEIAAARSRLAEAQAAAALARWRLDETKLYAPVDGVIRERVLEPGDLASPRRPAFTLARTDPLWVRAFVSGPDLGKIRPGMKAEVTTDSFPDKVYDGWLGFIAPTAEFTPKSVQTEELRTQLVYEVRVFVRNPQGELRLGMPVTATILLGAEQAESPVGQNETPSDSSTENGKAASPAGPPVP